MARITPILTNFTAGELSDRLEGRVDLAKYSNGCRRLENMTVFAQGGAKRRGGTRFVGEVKDSSKAVRLIPFEFSTEQAYIIEFGEGYCRFYINGGVIVESANPETVYEIVTPYTEADLRGLAFAQSADVLYIAHRNHPPQKLTRTAHDAWQLSAVPLNGLASGWGPAGNYPTAVAFFEQRLWWAGTGDRPQTLWGSRSGTYEDMTGGANDDDAVEYTIAAGQVNAITWLSPGKVLSVGTVGGEFVVSASSLNEAVTPSNVRIVRETTHGSTSVAPQRVGAAALFVQRAGRRLREHVYRLEQDGYVAPDLTLLADHVSRSGIVEMAFQEEPDSVLWCVLADGGLLGMTYNREQDVTAWHRHRFGGSFDGGAPVVESCAVIPESTGDELWLTVKRTLGGQIRRTVEVLTQGLEDEASQADAFFVDCGATFSGEPSSQISGLDHLDGEEVDILADGSVRGRQIVSQGTVFLDQPASVVHVGLPYRSTLETMQLEGGSSIGTAQGKTKRITSAIVRLYRSLGCLIGAPDETDRLPFRTASDPMGQPPALFSGDREILFPPGWSREAVIAVEQDQPLPLTVLAIISDMRLND
ncbi:MAG: hypothetical protein AAGH38_02185 [Pseudomonadota bacterium]